MSRWLAGRVYRSGTGIQWCLLLWSDAQLPYLDRLFVIKTPWFAVCLNWIMQPDKGDPHDHTATFLSIMLRGWYRELRKARAWRKWLNVTRRWFNYIRAADDDAHRIMEVSPGGCLTLCLMGPKRREWFYHTAEGLVHWSQYEAAMNAKVV